MRDLFDFLRWVLYFFILSDQARQAIRRQFALERRVIPPKKLHWVGGDRRKQPAVFQPLASQLVRLTLAMTAVFGVSVLVMRRDAALGLTMTLAYSGIMAIYAVYSTLRLRLKEQHG